MKNNGYSVSEAAELLNIAERTVIDWIHKGKLKAEKDGKSWRIIDDITKSNNVANHRNDAALIEWFKKQNEDLQSQNTALLRQLDENQKRSDTIIMQLTRQLEQQTLMLSDIENRSIWKRIKAVFATEAV